MSQPPEDPKQHLTQPPELDSLEEATEMLTNQVSALSEALQTIAQVQAEQVTLKQEVKAVREDVQENAVPKHEFEAAQTETAQARAKLQTRIRIFAISTACLALAVAVGAGVIAVYVAVHLAHNQRVAACEYRNAQSKAQAAKSKPFFEPFLAREKNNPKADPVMVDLITTIVNTPPQLTDCSKI